MVNSSEVALEKISHFFLLYPENIYKKGETIVRAQDNPKGVYYLKRGFVHIYFLSSSGETFMVHVFKPGAFFPLMWVVNDTPNVFHYDAMTTACIVRAPKEKFVEFLKSNSEVAYYATARLTAGLSGFVTRVGQLVLDNAYTKTILLLLYYADTFGEKVTEGILIRLPLTHREIASWIGTTRETASLQVELLLKRGIVTKRGRLLIICDTVALHREMGR